MTEFTGDTSLFIGRWQPLHKGHIKLIRTVLNEDKKVCIGIRNSKIDNKNPYTVNQRITMICKEFQYEIDKGLLTWAVLPDIKEIAHGRKVGWEVREIKLDKETENISATKIRKKLSSGYVIWLTGLPCSGKTTIGDLLAEKIRKLNKKVERLDGDIVRTGKLSDDLGFTKEDRDKNINRINFVSKLLSRNGTIVINSFVSPYRKTRDNIRKNLNNFIEVYVNTSAEECAKRDVKGMWKKAKEGKIKGFTGYDDPYEEPLNAEVICNTERETVEESVNKIVNYLKRKELI